MNLQNITGPGISLGLLYFVKARRKFCNIDLMLYYITLSFELLSLLASITLYFQRGVPRYLRLFPIFLLMTLSVELTAFVLAKQQIGTVFLFKIFITIEFEFYLYTVYHIIRGEKVKKFIIYALIIYPIVAIINISLVDKNAFSSVSYSVGCLLTVTVCIYYFFELFRLPKAINLLREPAFWICTGLLFYYSCSFPLFGLFNFLFTASNIILKNVGLILLVMNILLYSLFTIAFLCRMNFQKARTNTLS